MRISYNEDNSGIIKNLIVEKKQQKLTQIWFDVHATKSYNQTNLKKKVKDWIDNQVSKGKDFEYRVSCFFDNIGWRSSKLGKSFQSKNEEPIFYNPDDSDRDSEKAGNIKSLVIYVLSKN